MLVNYFLELVLLDYQFINKLPSELVASAVYLARATLKRKHEGLVWTPTLRHYTGYDVMDLQDTILKLHKLHHGAEEGALKSVYNKYKGQLYLRVALTTVLSTDEVDKWFDIYEELRVG